MHTATTYTFSAFHSALIQRRLARVGAFVVTAVCQVQSLIVYDLLYNLPSSRNRAVAV